MTQICYDTQTHIQESAIDRFMHEVASKDNNSVSFSELAKLFNQHFNIRDDDEKQFMPFYIEKLTNHIVKIASLKKSLGFTLETHF